LLTFSAVGGNDEGMSIEKRVYPRFYFEHDKLPVLKLQVSPDSDVLAEVLNISSGGVCLSISQEQENLPQKGRELRVRNLTFAGGPTIRDAAMKLCYFYCARDLKKMILGMEFSDFPQESRQGIERFIQEQAKKESQF
jgi:hypothetical protein